MSFKFNFSSTDINNGSTGEGNTLSDTDGKEKPRIPSCTMVKISDQERVGNIPVHSLSLPTGSIIKYVDSQHVVDIMKGKPNQCDGIRVAIESNSDLVPNVYEGGLKVWECSVDLTSYLSSLDIAFDGLKVLELGCGAGLPGLYAFIQGATVDFQDYNQEVLDLITIPNVLHNLREGTESDSCQFFAGDWTSLRELLLKEHIKSDTDKYDVILTSETIYSPDNYDKLHKLMVGTLKPTGVIYLAAKTYYFGVGGGTRDFEDMVKKKGTFTVQTCQEFSDGVQREILQMKFTAT